MAVTWQFKPMDNWFFRDSKPMNAGESAWLESIFPPTGQTLQGAIRTAILDNIGKDYESLKTDIDLQAIIGDADTLGKIQLSGPWLQKSRTTYYPLPLDLVNNARTDQWGFLTPSKEPLNCDLGLARMPAIKDSGFKVKEGHYIDVTGMSKLLQGDSNGISEHIFPLYTDEPVNSALADREPKVGLARDNEKRKAIDGMLFAIAPVRPRQDTSLAIHISGLNDGEEDKYLPHNDFMQLLGGEGRGSLP